MPITTSDEQYKRLRSYLNPLLKGKSVDAVLNALASGNAAYLINNVRAVNDQLYVATASEEYLDQRLADSGIVRPANIGLSDDVFRDIGIQVKNRKQVRDLLNQLLNSIFGDEFSRATNQARAYEPYALQDGDSLIINFDDRTAVPIQLSASQFKSIGAALAQEVADAITKGLRNLGYTGTAIAVNDGNGNYVELLSDTIGPASSVTVLGGRAQNVLKFDSVVSAGGNSSTQWTVSIQPGGVMRFTWTGGIDPQLGLVKVGNYVNIFGGGFASTANEGSYTVQKAVGGVSGSSYFEISNPLGVQSVVTQGSDTAVLFYNPSRKTLISRYTYAAVYQSSARLLQIFVPASTKVIRRDRIGSAHLHDQPNGTFTFNANAASGDHFAIANGVILTAGTDFPIGGSALITASNLAALINTTTPTQIQAYDDFAFTQQPVQGDTISVGTNVMWQGGATSTATFTNTTSNAYVDFVFNSMPTAAGAGQSAGVNIGDWVATHVPGDFPTYGMTSNYGGDGRGCGFVSSNANPVNGEVNLGVDIPSCIDNMVFWFNNYTAGTFTASRVGTNTLRCRLNNLTGAAGNDAYNNSVGYNSGVGSGQTPDGAITVVSPHIGTLNFAGGTTALGSGVGYIAIGAALADTLNNMVSYLSTYFIAANGTAALGTNPNTVRLTAGVSYPGAYGNGAYSVAANSAAITVSATLANGQSAAVPGLSNVTAIASSNVVTILPKTVDAILTVTYTGTQSITASGPQGDTGSLTSNQPGPYMYDPAQPFVISDIGTVLSQNLDGTMSRVVPVGDSSAFPDTQGFVVLGYGTQEQEGPIPYIARPSNNTLLISPAYTIKSTHVSGSDVALVAQKAPVSLSRDGLDYPFYITDVVSGRLYAQDLINSVAATGIKIVFTILYPSDVGLGKWATPYTENPQIWGE